MNRISSHIMLLGWMLFLLISCEKDDIPDSELPDWNKNRTTTIQVYSTMNNVPVVASGSSDFTAISSRIRSTSHSVALLHRADITIQGSSPFNPAVALAAASQKVPLFAMNRYAGQTAEGTGVLIGHTYTKSEIVVSANGTSFLKVDTKANASIPMTFGTITFDAQNQVESGAALVRSNLSDAVVVVGLVNKELKDLLKAKFPEQSYRFETVSGVNGGATQVIFAVSTKKWVLREYAETTVGSSGVSVFDLQYESL